MNIGELKATIRQGNQAAADGRQTLNQAADEAADAARLARMTIHDSQDEDAQAGLKLLTDAAHEVELTFRRFDAAVAHANKYLAKL